MDEVHMLSTSSFNALLKTLEEPPEHVKFLLATTDPQKLPVTVLSRCLQFNLKNMSPERIVGHLEFVLSKELIPFEQSALWQLARSADGSMRDALSLTDQAIAFGAGKISDVDVVAMLGTIDHKLIEKLVRALINGDGPGLLRAVAEFAELAPDYLGALGDLITFLHRLAIAQAMPEALDNSYGDRQIILELCQLLPPEDVQLFYQTALIGRRDLHLSPDPRLGLEMTLLRMLAFKPQGVVDVPTQKMVAPATSEPAAVSAELAPAVMAPVTIAAEPTPVEPAMQGPEPVIAAPNTAGATALITEPMPQTAAKEPLPWEDRPALTPTLNAPPEVAEPAKKSLEALLSAPALAGLKPASQIAAPLPKAVVTASAVKPALDASTLRDINRITPEHWLDLFDVLGVKGVLHSTVANCVLMRREDNQFFFLLDQNKGALFDDSHRLRFTDLLSDFFGIPVKAHIELTELHSNMVTPAINSENKRQQALAEATHNLQQEPIVQELLQQFNAVFHPDSVQVKTAQ
jgi:DNA polymerase-3 subunit gamma/tau